MRVVMGRSNNDYRQFTFGIIIIFIIMFGIMGKEFVFEQKKNKADEERYEKMVNEEGKFKLTQKILDEDHEQYVKNAEHGAKVFKNLITAFAGGFILVVILFFMRIFDIKRLFPEKYANLVMWIMLAGFGFMVIFGVMFFGSINKASSKSGDVASLKYDFYKANVKSRRVEKKEHTSRDSDGHMRTTTTYYYYLILDDDKEVQVSKIIYDRAENPGLYYCGSTEKGGIFSIYPDTEFELVQ